MAPRGLLGGAGQALTSVLLAGCVLAMVWAANGQAALRLAPIDSERERFQLQVLHEKLQHPWSLQFLPDGRMLVSERVGRLLLLGADGKLLARVGGLPAIRAEGQGGLLDVALDPAFADNRRLFLAFAAGPDRHHLGTEVASARLLDNRLVDLHTLFVAEPKSGGGRHFGGRLLVDGKYLYITLGERGQRERAQALDDHAGSVIRLLLDGRVPEDNPFVGKRGARPEIFTYGHRNVQGIARHPSTGQIWTHEHGPQGGDEINILKAGANYGWPVITYGVNYGIGTPIGEGTHKAGMAQPLYYWDPSIAPSGMSFYTGERFPRWQGSLFVGSLKFQLLVRLTLKEGKVVGEERLLERVLGRIRDVRQGPDGLIYLLTDSPEGLLVRLEPVP